jgi:hypothetical protein
MSYVNPDYRSKKDFKAAIRAGVQHDTYNPSGMFPTPQNGSDVIEGPHYPRPQRWCAKVRVKDGIVVSCEGADLGSKQLVVSG